MARLEGIRVRNFRALRDVTLGRVLSNQDPEPLTPMTAVIGKNGAGKSTLFDAFGFLADCLKFGVEEASDSRGRGGFDRIRSQGSSGAIQFEIHYRESANAHPVTYELSIGRAIDGRLYVESERLLQQRKGRKDGPPISFLTLIKGEGVALRGESGGDESANGDVAGDTEYVALDDRRKLGIATLGSLKQHPRISAFRRFIEGWYLSYFSPDAARGLPLAGPQRHLNVHGDNLGNVVQFLEREHPKAFRGVLARIAEKIPGVHKIDTEKTPDGRLLLRFNDRGFQDPFYAQQMSDGTLKMFAYLLLLEDPSPPPLLCIEEPENGLYHKLLESLAREFRLHASNEKAPSQIFVTTHQPYFVDALSPDEVWVLEKGLDGFATIRRAGDDPVVKNLATTGELPLGGLWYSDYLDAR